MYRMEIPYGTVKSAPWYESCKEGYACKPNTRYNNVEIQLEGARWHGAKPLAIRNNAITEAP